ncbi:membrane protein [Moniliophthora roreri MCA 2997]|uniref:Membrane protein n=2 Tax=Moniliophthora roreri TaxID=221103 RepID=V2XGG6_MONRO|nr:membrane protein [Moniliophthora roreri MCA 2997]KAI3604830.1 membrane protein [Moniliophthora roreri]
MSSAGTIIWISIRPLLRLILCTACGFIITKADLFPTVAARSLGQIILNITLPCLMFSKAVPAFTPENVGAIGPLTLVAFLYGAIGIAVAYITKQLFWIPHRFRYGILVAGGWSNWGDIPTSVIMSLTSAAPFGGPQDQTLAVAYISVFILVYLITLFPLGGHLWVAKDFVGPDVEPDELREAIQKKRRALFWWFKDIRRSRRLREKRKDPEDPAPEPKESKPMDEPQSALPQGPRPRHSKHVSFFDDGTTAAPTEGITSPAPTEWLISPAPTVTATTENHQEPVLSTSKTQSASETEKSKLLGRYPRLLMVSGTVKTAIKSALTPASLAILTSFPIALIPKLKGLFVELPGSGIPNAPDNIPPLAFILDFTQFMGAASVPLGLIGLGSALARLHVPRDEWRTLPIGAILSLAVGKMIITPILGVLITQGFVHAGLINSEDKVVQFVCIFFSCLPTATTQVFLTQVYSGTGTAEYFSPFLIPQYIIMFFSMTGLTAYSLQYLF